MLTMEQILAIVNDCEVEEAKNAAIYLALMVLVVCPVLVYGLRKLFKCGFSVCALFGCFLIAMATKPPAPRITWDTGLSNNGTYFDTNNWQTIYFRWNKAASIAGTEPVYFAAKDDRYPELEWDEIGQSTAGQLAWSYTFPVGANATNYLYYVFTIGEVHTNGVWLGNILQKAAPGTCWTDKMIFMKSRLELNGKQIAPFKEEQ